MRIYSPALAVVFAATRHCSGLAVSTMKNSDTTLIGDTVSTETGRFHLNVERRLRRAERDNPTDDDERMESGPLKEVIGSVIIGTDTVGSAASFLKKKTRLIRKRIGMADDKVVAVAADNEKKIDAMQAALSEKLTKLSDDYHAATEALEKSRKKMEVMDAEHKAKVEELLGEFDALSMEQPYMSINDWASNALAYYSQIVKKHETLRLEIRAASEKAEMYQGLITDLKKLIPMINRETVAREVMRDNKLAKEMDTHTAEHSAKPLGGGHE